MDPWEKIEPILVLINLDIPQEIRKREAKSQETLVIQVAAVNKTWHNKVVQVLWSLEIQTSSRPVKSK